MTQGKIKLSIYPRVNKNLGKAMKALLATLVKSYKISMRNERELRFTDPEKSAFFHGRANGLMSAARQLKESL